MFSIIVAGGGRNLGPCVVCVGYYDKDKTWVFYKEYPGCHAIWPYFIGIPYYRVRDIFVLHACDHFGILEYAQRASLRHIHKLGVEGWFRVPLLKLLGIYRRGRSRQAIPVVLVKTFSRLFAGLTSHCHLFFNIIFLFDSLFFARELAYLFWDNAFFFIF